jgi:two-component system sensor histidine kinase UhpB
MVPTETVAPALLTAHETRRPRKRTLVDAVWRPLPGRRQSAGALQSPRQAAAPRPGLDDESQSWWKGLHALQRLRRWAVAEIDERLCHEAAFHIRLRERGRSVSPGGEIDDLAVQAADGSAVRAVASAFNEMVDRLEAERRESARRALLAQEGERRRIAQELHDQVGQTLTGVMLQVEALAGTIPEEFREQLEELRATAREGIEDVRRIARRLRPEALDLGLKHALAALAAAFSESVRIERWLDDGPPLSEERELVIYRVAQEALTNVARHANAAHVQLRLKRTNEQIVLSVRDDGQGLPHDALLSTQGIRGMRERATLIGGELSITGNPGNGTVVQLSIPLDEEGHDDLTNDTHPRR